MRRFDFSSLPAIETMINYVHRSDPLPEQYYHDCPDGKEWSNIRLDPQEALVRDISSIRADFDLDRDGVCFIDGWSDFTQFDDEDAIRKDLYPQVIKKAQALLGVTDIHVIDHGIRRRSHGMESEFKPQGASLKRKVSDMAHCDYTDHSASIPIWWNFGAEADALSRKRYAIYNFWWPVRGPLYDYPLALCVNGSVANSDYVEIRTYFDPRQVTPVLGLVHHPKHEWIYQEGMTEDETMVFRTWDTARPVSSCVPHSAVPDPNAPADMVPRESIEVRVLAFYD